MLCLVKQIHKVYLEMKKLLLQSTINSTIQRIEMVKSKRNHALQVQTFQLSQPNEIQVSQPIKKSYPTGKVSI